MDRLNYFSSRYEDKRKRIRRGPRGWRASSSSSEEDEEVKVPSPRRGEGCSQRTLSSRSRIRPLFPPRPVSRKRKGENPEEEEKRMKRRIRRRRRRSYTVVSEIPYFKGVFPLEEADLYVKPLQSFDSPVGLRMREEISPPLSMDSGYGGGYSRPPSATVSGHSNGKEPHQNEEAFFLCPNCGLFKRHDHCQCDSGEEDFGVGKERRIIEPFGGGSSKARTIGVVEPIVIQKSSKAATSKPLLKRGSSPRPYRRMKRRKKRNHHHHYGRSGETSSDVDGDLDSSSSSSSSSGSSCHEEEDERNFSKDKNKHRHVSPHYLNSSVVLSSQVSSLPHPSSEEIDKKALLCSSGGILPAPLEENHSSFTPELGQSDFPKTTVPSSNSDILQASISSLFDDHIPHVDDLLTNIDLQPIGGPETTEVHRELPHDKTLFRSEEKEVEDWIYCQEKGCGFWTRKNSRMERHIACHLPDTKYYKCPDCPLRFYSLAKMLRHDRRIHTGVKEYECRVCDAEVTDITIHMRVHKEEKQFECQVCPMRFRHKNSLVRHLCQHTGERPYPCSLCDTAFVSLHRLKEHVKRHHDNAPQKPTPPPSKKPGSSKTSSSLITSQTLIYNQTESISSSGSGLPTLYSISSNAASSNTSSSSQSSSSLLLLTEPSKSGLLYIASPLINSQTLLFQAGTGGPSPFIIHTPSPPGGSTLSSSQQQGPGPEPGRLKIQGPFTCRDCGRNYKLENFLIAHRRNCSPKVMNRTTTTIN